MGAFRVWGEEEVKAIETVLISLLMLIIGGAVGYFVRKQMAEAKLGAAELQASALLEEARRDAEAKQREALLDAKEQIHRMRQEAEAHIRDERQEMQRWERRVSKREEGLER